MSELFVKYLENESLVNCNISALFKIICGVIEYIYIYHGFGCFRVMVGYRKPYDGLGNMLELGP